MQRQRVQHLPQRPAVPFGPVAARTQSSGTRASCFDGAGSTSSGLRRRAAKSLRPFVFVASGLPSGSAFFCQRDNCVLVMPRSESVGTVALLRPCRLMLVAAVAALAWLAAGSAGARKIVTYPSGRVAFAILERRFPRSNEPLVTASSSSSRRVSLPWAAWHEARRPGGARPSPAPWRGLSGTQSMTDAETFPQTEPQR